MGVGQPVEHHLGFEEAAEAWATVAAVRAEVVRVGLPVVAMVAVVARAKEVGAPVEPAAAEAAAVAAAPDSSPAG